MGNSLGIERIYKASKRKYLWNMLVRSISSKMMEARKSNQSYSNIKRYFFSFGLPFIFAFYKIYTLFCFSKVICFIFTTLSLGCMFSSSPLLALSRNRDFLCSLNLPSVRAPFIWLECIEAISLLCFLYSFLVVLWVCSMICECRIRFLWVLSNFSSGIKFVLKHPFWSIST